MICRFCGSTELVWDHSLGLVVCSACGSVLGGILDEWAPPHTTQRARRGRRLRIVDGRGSSLEVNRLHLIASLVNSRALKLLSGYRVVRLALNLVDSDPILKARTTRGRVAIALYIVYRALGYSKTRSKLLASKACRVSMKSLERVEKTYRGRVGELEAKARELLERLAREEKLPPIPLL